MCPQESPTNLELRAPGEHQAQVVASKRMNVRTRVMYATALFRQTTSVGLSGTGGATLNVVLLHMTVGEGNNTFEYL